MTERGSGAAVALFGLLLGVSGEAQERLTLADAAARALSYYPSVQASAAAVESAEASVEEADAGRFPTLAVGASATRYQEPMIVHPIHAFTPNFLPPFDENLFQALAEVRYELYDGGGRSSRRAESRARKEGAQSSLLEARQRLLSQLIREYLSVLSRAKMLEAQDGLIQALEAEHSRVKQLFDVGRAATVDLLRVEASIAAARAERVRLLSFLDVSQRNVARLVGLDASETEAAKLAPVTVVDASLPPREEIQRSALESSPSARVAREELAAAEAAVDGSESRRLPTVNVDGRYINYGSASGANSLEWNVGLSVAYTVFNGGAVSSAVARASSAARVAREKLRWAELDVAGDVDRALSAIEEARARVESLKTAEARFAEVSRIEKLRLETGVGTEADYLRAEADRFSAEAGLIDAGYSEVAARAELARVTGALSPDWVRGNFRSEP
jgi:outer membrane protein TolC